ncbi:MAG: membrane protein insertion efficiency factor YidD [Syntrophobacteraceae bacterium]|nr:membrane protein insertion efficiency factor YidD [Syntrophobacteraceae bacterium]
MIRWIFLGLIRTYQIMISPLFPQACRFSPSCSRYAYDAIEIHGVPRGIYLGLRRVLRCHPFSPGGYDPVPQRSFGSDK